MITVDKKTRRLTVTDKAGNILHECSVSLGKEPCGTKASEGDGRTPEGEYYICSVNRSSRFHISLGISYPGPADARNAYFQKRITRSELLLIKLLCRLKLRPLWHTGLGGFVMLHGADPAGRTGDWTAGCIAVSDQDIEKIAALCHRGCRIVIK